MADCTEGILIDLSEPVTEVFLDDELPDLLPTLPQVISRPEPMDVSMKNASGLLDISDDKPAEDKSSIGADDFIDAEQFDFDVPTTPVTSSESADSADEEEVFFGPVSHIERCVATAVESVNEISRPLSPLNPRQVAEIVKEAHAVASRISSSASGTKKRKAVGKEKLTCVKQLSLAAVIDNHCPNRKDKSQTASSLSPVGKLMNSVSKMQVDDSIDNCDMANKENDVKYGAQPAESMGVQQPDIIDSSGRARKRHTRMGTYTVNNIPLEMQSLERRKSLPVVDSSPSEGLCIKRSKLDFNETKEQNKRVGVTAKANKGCVSRLQKPRVTALPSKIPADSFQKKAPAGGMSNTENSTINQKSRLSAPKAGKVSSLPMSKLKLPGSQPAQVNSAIPAVKGSLAAPPASKLQRMKPSGLKRCGSFQQKGSEGPVKPGPLKAFAPAKEQKEKLERSAPTVTPLKANTQVQRKKLMSTSFTSGNESCSNKNMESPPSVMTRRKSCLPTPTKSQRSGSQSSLNSSRSSSTSSQSHDHLQDSKITQPGAVTGSIGKYNRMDFPDESSPSVLRPRSQLVTNTPNMPQRKKSPWSPIERRKPQDNLEQAIMCTKKTRNSICPL